MKSKIKSLILFFVLSATFIGCETYSDPKVEYSPIYPISGEWRVRITNLNTGTLVAQSMYTLATYNTANNDNNQMWIRTGSQIPTFTPTTTIPRSLMSKISCDVAGLSFSTTSITQNLNVAADKAKWPAYTVNAVIDTISITEGKITLNSVTMPSKVTADRIFFKMTKTKSPGVTYSVEGYRRTRWAEDETVLDFK